MFPLQQTNKKNIGCVDFFRENFLFIVEKLLEKYQVI
jgi:hypothetical protein